MLFLSLREVKIFSILTAFSDYLVPLYLWWSQQTIILHYSKKHDCVLSQTLKQPIVLALISITTWHTKLDIFVLKQNLNTSIDYSQTSFATKSSTKLCRISYENFVPQSHKLSAQSLYKWMRRHVMTVVYGHTFGMLINISEG